MTIDKIFDVVDKRNNVGAVKVAYVQELYQNLSIFIEFSSNKIKLLFNGVLWLKSLHESKICSRFKYKRKRHISFQWKRISEISWILNENRLDYRRKVITNMKFVPNQKVSNTSEKGLKISSLSQ
ncbi:CLUMA_CG002146, isoform A [Clunio marinus]|uniref:CLUMA_CG002146, isoform A n=1 Tax=Clunio marinus TaxID=568069 RepID=A0A1J1HQ79_9DIPT|nr:CLUMA_CG002146, isoform A [Clunio marinus]